jgi:hypothetical protein
LAARLERTKAMTFEQCAKAYIKAQEPGWRNPKHAAQWPATLETYVYPVLGNVPVQSIDTAIVLKVLEPIWTRRTETASRIRGRIESVLDWAAAAGYRTPATGPATIRADGRIFSKTCCLPAEK